MNISPARKSAFEILYKIEKDKAFSSILLNQYEIALGKKDRSLCHELVLGILRKKLYLDKIIQQLTKKKIRSFDLEVINSLRIGLYQLIFLDKIPSYSAINESVNLVKFAKKKSASGLVNAVLRRASREKIEISFSNELEKISIETSHPIWLIEKWIRQFGIEETEKLAIANNNIPSVFFRLTARFYKENLEKQTEILNEIENYSTRSTLANYGFIAKHFNENLLQLAENGFIYFQDEGSQLVASAIDLKVGEKFLDLCASPGSKTTFIGCNIVKNNLHNLIIAGDFYHHRLLALANNCFNQNLEFVNIIQYDATNSLPFTENIFDVILLDAPCSGTGTIRNNPEIRYNLEEKDFEILSNKQLKILQNASKLIKKGGRLIYSTCSLEFEENESVVNKFLEANKDFSKVKPKLLKKLINSDDFAKTFPQINNTDGFFIAELARIY